MVETVDRNKKGNYLIDGVECISVTTLMKKVLGLPESMVKYYHCKLGWEGAMEDMKAKGNYGTGVHDQFDKHYFNNEPVTDDLKDRVEQIDKIYEELGLELIKGETLLYSKKLKSAGRNDLYAVSNKFKLPQWYFIDYKSGSTQRTKELVQISAYAYFALEMGLIPKGSEGQLNGIILHVGREPDAKVSKTVFSPTQMKIGFKAFKSLLSYYRLTESIKLKKGE